MRRSQGFRVRSTRKEGMVISHRLSKTAEPTPKKA